jgi:sec-independent protein translocase protein TatA
MGRLEEIAVIVFLGLIFFSPNKLLDIAKSLGSSLHEFKKAINPESQTAQPAQATAAPSAPSRAPRARKAAVAKKTGKSKRA